MIDSERARRAAARAERPERFLAALRAFDALNDDDPRRVAWEGVELGMELFYSQALFAKTLELDPEASEPLLLAARSQHLCRWKIPRSDYPGGRTGYLKWRSDLKRYHAQIAGETLERTGYGAAVVDRVRELNLKRDLGSDPECQTLEDALCLVFLERQFAEFSKRTDEAVMVGILRKTWAKMSDGGRAAALALPMDRKRRALVEAALAE